MNDTDTDLDLIAFLVADPLLTVAEAAELASARPRPAADGPPCPCPVCQPAPEVTA